MSIVDGIDQEKIIIRHSKTSDIEALAKLSKIGFPGMDPFEPSHFESHLEIFPDGQFCIEYDGKIIGSCSSMIINFDDYSPKDDFERITADGYITNHNPHGKNLYGIDVVVHPSYRGMKFGNKLYEKRRRLCEKLNLKSIIFGGRIPDYYKYSDEMSVVKYVKEVLNRTIYDSTLTFQINQGFECKGVITNYLPDDQSSLGYATLMEWINSEYKE